MRLTALIGLVLMTAASTALAAGKEPPTTQGSKVDGAPTGKKGEWVQVPITIGKAKCLMCGVAADRTTGDVYVLPLPCRLELASTVGLFAASVSRPT